LIARSRAVRWALKSRNPPAVTIVRERGDALLAGLLRSRRCGRPQSQNWCVVSAETGGVPCDFLTASPPAEKPAARED
jgi:hypothetical protein